MRVEAKVPWSISHLCPVFINVPPHLTPCMLLVPRKQTEKKVRSQNAVAFFRDTHLVKAELKITMLLLLSCFSRVRLCVTP